MKLYKNWLKQARNNNSKVPFPLVGTSLLAAAFLSACSPSKPSNQLTTGTLSENILTTARIHSAPSLAGLTLSRAKISPDGKIVTVLKGRKTDGNQKDLWAIDLETGTESLLVSSTDLLAGPEVLSDEEKNRRERAREYSRGIISYSWDDTGRNLLFPLGGDVYLYDVLTKQPQQLTNTDGFESDAKLSPSGRYISYVRDNELFVKDRNSGQERQLSRGSTDTIRNATASFVVQEELGRATGYWLSEDEWRFAYTQIDESPIAVENRIEMSGSGLKTIAQRYPFAGTPNATVKLGIVSVRGGPTIWADLGTDPDVYLTRVNWSKDSQHIYVGILSRDHKSLKIYDINPFTGSSTILFEETSDTWINVRGDLHPLDDGSLIWTSERDGFRHVYHYKTGASAPTQITKGNWPITKLNCVDEANKTLYFTGWRESALERNLYTVNFDGQNLRQISGKSFVSDREKSTWGHGWNSAKFSKNCAAYIGGFSNKKTPPQTRAFDNTGKALTWLNENKLDATHPYYPYLDAHIDPQFGQIPAPDGNMMDYALYRPKHIKAGARLPSVTIVYGGPGAQRVHNGWDSKAYLPQILAAKGFVVFLLDNRGSTARGKAFEDHLYRAMGKAEVVDQTIGAEFLKRLRFIDPDRMGVYGWSYGGYMTLHMLAQTDLYKSGVSGAPVTDWRLYDTAYTERYLGSPVEGDKNYTKGAYEHGDVFTHLEGLTEDFLLIHGMADDNVVFRHTIKLMDAMQRRGAKNMRVMTYPGEKHGFRAQHNQIHRDNQIVDFFEDTLLPKKEPH